MFYKSNFNKDLNKWSLNNDVYLSNILDNKVYDQEITWNVDIEDLFGDGYNDYLERRKIRVLKELCIV